MKNEKNMNKLLYSFDISYQIKYLQERFYVKKILPTVSLVNVV